MGKEVFLKIKNLLESGNIEFEHLEHEHVHRSEEAAKIRGNTIQQAAKAIIMKARTNDKSSFLFMCVLPGDKKIDLKKIKKELSVKNISLASPEEVFEATGCTIGSVPPFAPVFGMDLYVEPSVFRQERIVFSAGTHNDSVRMKSSDYKKILNPVIIDFAFENS